MPGRLKTPNEGRRLNDANQRARISIGLLCLSLILASQSLLSFVQPVPMSPTQLGQLVSRVALYPDPHYWPTYSLLRLTGAKFLKLRHGLISTAI
jgi:hypothetical protein